MTSKQRKRLRIKSGQTALAIQRMRDDARCLERLASGKDRPQGKSGKATIRHIIASQYVGSGKWTSFPFHHGRTFIRKELADGGCKTHL